MEKRTPPTLAPSAPRAESETETEQIKPQDHTPKPIKPPLFERVLVYNYEQHTLRVTDPHDIPAAPIIHILPLPPHLPWRLTVFVDYENESIPSLRNVDAEGNGNVELVRFHLDKLGWWNNILRRFGGIRVLYVVGGWGEWLPNRVPNRVRRR